MSFKVLVVDDDDIIVLLHNILIKENNLSSAPLGFENGKDALDYLDVQDHTEDDYLLLLDINMPVMNGWQLLDTIKASKFADRVSAVIATSSVDYEDHEKAKEYPQIVAYFEKPLDERSFNKIKKLPQVAAHLPEID